MDSNISVKANGSLKAIIILDILMIASMGLSYQFPALNVLYSVLVPFYVTYNIFAVFAEIMFMFVLNSNKYQKEVSSSMINSVKGKYVSLKSNMFFNIFNVLENTILIGLAINTNHLFVAKLTLLSSIVLYFPFLYSFRKIVEDNNKKILNDFNKECSSITTKEELEKSISLFDSQDNFSYEININNELSIINVTFTETDKYKKLAIENWKKFVESKLSPLTVLIVDVK